MCMWSLGPLAFHFQKFKGCQHYGDPLLVTSSSVGTEQGPTHTPPLREALFPTSGTCGRGPNKKVSSTYRVIPTILDQCERLVGRYVRNHCRYYCWVLKAVAGNKYLPHVSLQTLHRDASIAGKFS